VWPRLKQACHSKQLSTDILTLNTTASSSLSQVDIPPELIQYVDNGRNPEIYTREFVENTRRDNQLLKGKKEAHAAFRDTLAREMGKVFPELRDDIEMVVEKTGGDKSVVFGAGGAV
jgi:mediator of RNA polymerase II transcription subunit 10